MLIGVSRALGAQARGESTDCRDGVPAASAMIMAVAVSGMHYTGMAAMRVHAAPGGGMAAMGGGATGSAFLVPLILGITVLTFVMTVIITLAPTEAEIRADAALMERIAKRSESAQRPSP